MKIIVNLVITTILALSFTACEDKKEFKDTLKIEKVEKVKLPKPKWERRLILADEQTETWYDDADYSEIAASNIAFIYRTKIKDYKKAINWYLYSDSIKTSSLNYLGLGIAYEDLLDYQNSIKYYKKTFLLGNVSGANNLGILYQEKLKDLKKAELWYKKAIEIDSTSSLKGIADMYHFNLKDDIKASAYLINLLVYPDYANKKEKTINYLKNKWEISDETIQKGYELQLTMPGLPKRYTGGI